MNAVTEDFKPLTSGQLISTALLPKNLEEALRLADILAKSDIVPKDYIGKPGNVLVAIQWGMEIGLGPLQALQNIASINGRPCVWGDAMLALVRSSGLLESIREDVDDNIAVCTVKRKGAAPVTREFSMTDAKKAGLAGKSGPWQQYPKRMMQMRARAWALRDEFPDVLKGIASAEEVQDERDITESVEVVERAPSSRAESAKDKLRAKAAQKPAPDHRAWLKTVLARLASAHNNATLAPCKADIQGYAECEERAEAWEAYKARVTEIKAEFEARQSQAPVVTYESLVERFESATTPDALDEAASLIDSLEDEGQREALRNAYADLRERLGHA